MNRENKTLTIVGIFVLISVALIVSLTNRDMKREVTLADTEEKMFEAIGHYEFATTGNHNYSRETNDFILSYPNMNQNVSYSWTAIKSNIGIDNYTNFSGGYLSVDGKINKIILNYTSNSNSGKIVVVFPNGEYKVIDTHTKDDVIDLTNDFRDKNAGNGWYYVSFVNFAESPRLAWSITAVYENSNLPLRSVELFKVLTNVTNSYSLDFYSGVQKDHNFQIVGALSSNTNDGSKVYAVLDNNQDFQLYNRSDNHFNERTNDKFLINKIPAQQYPSVDDGGSLDVFNEKLTDEYLGNHKIKGLKIASSPDQILVLSIGISQDVVEPKVTIDTKINAYDRFKTGDKVTVQSEVKNNSREDGVCAKANNITIVSSVDTVLSDITNVKARYQDADYPATYSASDNTVVVEMESFDCSSNIVLTYEGTINETINKKLEEALQENPNNPEYRVEGTIYRINTELTVNYYIDSRGILRADTLNDTDSVSSPMRLRIITKHVDMSGNELVPDVIQEIFYGDDYTTTKSDDVPDDYELVETPNNYIGHNIKNRDDIVVIYRYQRKVARIITQYIDKDTGFALDSEKVDEVEYGERYTTYNNPLKECFKYYDFTDEIDGVASGIAKGDVKVIYYYRIKKGVVEVHYIDKDTNEELEAPTYTTYDYLQNYSTIQKDIFLYYLFDSVEGDPTGTVLEDRIVVTYKYTKKPATIYTHHLIDGTNQKIADTVITPVSFGERYETSAATIPNNYELKTKTDNFEGYVEQVRVNVYYYYQKKDSNLSTSITMDGTKKITSRNNKVTYAITYNADVVDYIGDGTIKIVDTLPYQIDEERSNLDSGVYNASNKTITWTIPWNDIDSYNNKGSKSIVLNIELQYLNIDPTNRILINAVNGTITLDNNSRSVEDKVNTDVLIPGTILVHHYLKGTEEKVFEDETSTGLSGDTYISTAKYREGYDLVNEEQSMTHTYKEGITEVIYEYIHLSYDITVNGDEGKGIITGNEKVFYGENSRENNIIITANDGYVIESIVVDGTEIELTNAKQMILDNFKNVKENHKVDVTFTEELIPVPITGKTNYIWFVLIGLVVVLGAIIVPKLILNKK